jgi:hypothetical protein
MARFQKKKFINGSSDSKQPHQAASMSSCLAVCQSSYLSAAVLHAGGQIKTMNFASSYDH